MAKKVSKTAVGIFLFGALVLIVAAVILLGSGKFFKKSVPIVMYFEGSVQGLNVGSPVVYHGVKVGEVTGIRIVFDPKVMKAQIPVYAELIQGSMQAADTTAEQRMRTLQKNPELFARELVAKGLRAQLQTQSFVTGQLMVGLDFFPDKTRRVVGTESKYIEIPTVTSSLEQLQERIAKVPIEELVQKMADAMTSIDKIVSSPDIPKITRSVDQGVNDIRQLVNNLNAQITPVLASIKSMSDDAKTLTGRLDPLTVSITKTSADASASLVAMKVVLDRLDSITRDDSVPLYRFNRAMEEFEEAARSIRVLVSSLERQPESLLWGKRNVKGGTK